MPSAQQIAFGIERIEATLPRLCLLPQGGTAVGTGLNAPAGFDAVFCDEVSALSGVTFRPNPSKFEGMGAHDALVEASGALNVVAVSLTKIANDIRLLASGPRCGLGELVLPHDGLTSSIMPGKRNPTIAEVRGAGGVAVMGNHATISMAGAAGTFELNVAKPVIIDRTPAIDPDPGRQCSVFALRLVQDLDVDRELLAANVANALLLPTVLNPVLGYDRVAQITTKALTDGTPPREAALALAFLTGGGV